MKTQKQLLDDLVERVGIKALAKLAGNGEIFIPNEVSIRLQDTPVYNGDDAAENVIPLSGIAMPLSGIVSYGQSDYGVMEVGNLVNFGKVLFPSTRDEKDERPHDTAENYVRIMQVMANTGLVEQKQEGFLLDLEDLQGTDSHKFKQNTVSPFSTSGGSCCYSFKSPVGDGRGSLTFHRDQQKTLELYVTIHELQKEGK